MEDLARHSGDQSSPKNGIPPGIQEQFLRHVQREGESFPGRRDVLVIPEELFALKLNEGGSVLRTYYQYSPGLNDKEAKFNFRYRSYIQVDEKTGYVSNMFFWEDEAISARLSVSFQDGSLRTVGLTGNFPDYLSIDYLGTVEHNLRTLKVQPYQPRYYDGDAEAARLVLFDNPGKYRTEEQGGSHQLYMTSLRREGEIRKPDPAGETVFIYDGAESRVVIERRNASGFPGLYASVPLIQTLSGSAETQAFLQEISLLNQNPLIPNTDADKVGKGMTPYEIADIQISHR